MLLQGEIDALTLLQCGMANVVSVLNGAPVPPDKLPPLSRVVLPPAHRDHSFAFMQELYRGLLSKLSTVVLATDADGPGDYAALQLAARLLRRHEELTVWRVDWRPGGGKDANEVLVAGGELKVWKCVVNSQIMQL